MRYETAALHDLTNAAGAGLLLVHAPSGLGLLNQRGNDQDQPGSWAPFGGMVDPGESPEDAALRELMEEAGIDASMYDLHLLDTSEPTAEGFVFYTFVAFVDEKPAVAIEQDEVLGFGWFHLDPARLPTPQHPGFHLTTRTSAWTALLDSISAGEGMSVTSRIKTADEYTWFKYKGADDVHLYRQGKYHTVSRGTVFGVRWSSDRKKMRLVLKELGENFVFTIDQFTANLLHKGI